MTGSARDAHLQGGDETRRRAAADPHLRRARVSAAAGVVRLPHAHRFSAHRKSCLTQPQALLASRQSAVSASHCRHAWLSYECGYSGGEAASAPTRKAASSHCGSRPLRCAISVARIAVSAPPKLFASTCTQCAFAWDTGSSVHPFLTPRVELHTLRAPTLRLNQKTAQGVCPWTASWRGHKATPGWWCAGRPP